MLDLDDLERRVQARSNWSHQDVLDLIAELRASRKVVEAAQKISEWRGSVAINHLRQLDKELGEMCAALAELQTINVRSEDGA